MNQCLRAYDFTTKPEMMQMAVELMNVCLYLPRENSTKVFRGVSE
jgi:hypothetical protein